MTSERFSKAVAIRAACDQGARLRFRNDGKLYTLDSITNDGHLNMRPVDPTPRGELTSLPFVDPEDVEVVRS